MERLTLSVVRLVLSAFVLSIVAVGCDGDGEAAPADISGVWQGPYTTPVQSGTIIFSIQQQGSSVTGTWQALWTRAEAEGVLSGTISGTYANGVATITLLGEGDGITAAISFSGNTALGTGTTDEGELTFTLQKQS